jgi:ribose transport system permease protein
LRIALLGIGGRILPHSQAAWAAVATVLLLVFGGLFAPSTVSPGAVMTMLPFVAILAVAAIGQHLVIQQHGLDLSVAGIMSFAGVTITAYPHLDAGSWETLFYILLTLAMGLAVGAVNGVIVTLLEVPALVTTIGINSLLLGATMYVSGGFAQQAPPPLNRFGVGHVLGVPDTIYVMLAVAAGAIFVIARTTLGRRFVAISVNPVAARAVGVPIEAYSIATYMLAGFCYAGAGVLLAGYLLSPTVFCGLPYLLATIAAVVVGGNSIGGGARGSIAATVIGAFFLTYLGQLVLAVGFTTAMQDIVQALIVIGSVALPEATRRMHHA